MRPSGWWLALALWCLAAPSLGCEPFGDSEDAIDTTSTSTRQIGPEGGEVVSADGRVRLVIPPGALVADELFTIQDTAGVPAGHVGDAYLIGPTGLVFQADVVVEFSYFGRVVADPTALAVAKIFRGEWQPLPFAGLDTEGMTVSGLTRHLSAFGLIDATGVRPLTPPDEACSGGPSECLPTCIDTVRLTRECRRDESATEGAPTSACVVTAQVDCAGVGQACALGECLPGVCESDSDCVSGCVSRYGAVHGQCATGACVYQAVPCPSGDCNAGACAAESCAGDADCPAVCDGATVVYRACGAGGHCELVSQLPCGDLGQTCSDGACVAESCHMDSDCPTDCSGATMRRGACGVDGNCVFESTYCPGSGQVCVAGDCVGGACSMDADCDAFCDGDVATAGFCQAGQCEFASTIDCAARGQRCRDGLCVTDTSGCDADCAGCCLDGVCVAGDTVEACGGDGRTCAVCPLYHGCDGGSCVCTSDCETPGLRTCLGPDEVWECQEVVRTPTPCYRAVLLERCAQSGGVDPLVCRAGACTTP